MYMLSIGHIALVGAIALFTLLVNLPFGYMRQRVRKFSFKWFLYIHIPIPLIVLIRVSSGLDYKVIPLFLAAAVTGQVVGGRIKSGRPSPGNGARG